MLGQEHSLDKKVVLHVRTRDKGLSACHPVLWGANRE